MNVTVYALGELISEDLLKALREVFPNPLPALDESDRKIFLRVGQQQVIDFLQSQFNERYAKGD